MLLVVSATDFEMGAFRGAFGQTGNVLYLVTGLGPVETAVKVTRMLGETDKTLKGVVNLGVAGAYVDRGLNLLDICLADREIFGDLGICAGEKVIALDGSSLQVKTEFSLQNTLLNRAEKLFTDHNISYKKGRFVTVNCSSGTADRGRYLRDKYQAICENMEGASVARVCEEYGLPCLEIRSISNFVVDRNIGNWQLQEACKAVGHAAAVLLSDLVAHLAS